MKKNSLRFFSLLLVLVLIIGCLSFDGFAADTTPKPVITVLGNVEKPAGVDELATIRVSANNLSSVKGMDLTLTADTGVKFESITGDFLDANGAKKITLTENDNFTRSDSKIRIVSGFVIEPVDSLSAVIKLSASVVKNYNIAVNVVLVNDKEKKFQSGTYCSENGTFIISKQTSEQYSPASNENFAVDDADYFVPYGGFYQKLSETSYKYPTKNPDGTFNVSSGANYEYKKFKLPTNEGQVTTFSASSKAADNNSTLEYEKYNGIQFVSYALDKEADYGTLIVKGNFDEFCEKMRSNKPDQYIEKSAIINRFVELLKTNNRTENEWYSVGYTYLGETKYVQFAFIPRTKKMWSGNAHIQYALRVYKVNAGESFTAIGYKKVKNKDQFNYQFSNEYNTATY